MRTFAKSPVVRCKGGGFGNCSGVFLIKTRVFQRKPRGNVKNRGAFEKNGGFQIFKKRMVVVKLRLVLRNGIRCTF